MYKKYTINSRVGWSFLGKKVISFNCENQKIAIWNESASLIWQKIADGINSKNIIDWLSAEYKIGQKQATLDFLSFMSEVSSMGFLKKTKFSKNTIDNNIDITDNITNETKNGEKILTMIEMESIKKLIPFAVTLEVTSKCNENCIHCYMERKKEELSLEQIKKVLKEIKDEGCIFVNFTGGEFFARKDALDIIEYASSLKLVIDILSNGTLITEKIARFLSKHSVRRVQISLYGSNPETHDSVTRVKNSFLRSMKAIEFLRKNKIKVEIAFPLMRQNFNERYLVKQLAESLECVMSPGYIITARNNGERDTFSLRLNDEQLKEFLRDETLSRLYTGRKPFEEHQLYLHFTDLADAPPCFSGFNTCSISPQGKVVPCNQLIYEVGDLQKESFKKIWRKSEKLQYIRNLHIRDLKKCIKCESLKACSRCPGLALLEEKDILGISPENCRITKFCEQIAKERRKL